MSLLTSVQIPLLAGTTNVEIKGGSSIVFIGANGAGKTRLGVFLERTLDDLQIEVHRIAAHRSLLLNPNVVPPSFEVAMKRLQYGLDQGNFHHKEGHRWSGKPETALLSDFDHLLSALYAENNEVSVEYRQNQIKKPSAEQPPKARLDKLKEIWETVLPHRELVVLAGNIKTKSRDVPPQEYSASEMSDGERDIFYVIGQALLAQLDTVLIFDGPELHTNKSILSRLWDVIESARPDCTFIYITHDVEFASSRHAATKYAVHAYQKIPNEVWDIEIVPEATGIRDDVITKIIGSRRPVLFVEGDQGGLDFSLYRRVYSDFTVIPVGSCEEVIRNVRSFAATPTLHRVACAGLVDADGRTDQEALELEKKGIYCLPVSEVENLLLLPEVFLAIEKELKFEEKDAQEKLNKLRAFVFNQANQQIHQVCSRYTKRRVDAEMKKITLSDASISDFDIEFEAAVHKIIPSAIYNDIKSRIAAAIESQGYEQVLFHYDNKGLLSEMAKQLGCSPQKNLEEFIGRILRADECSELHTALAVYLPKPKLTY
jgi:energy-coupling factor transporter ATP-binding protein EcfA2